MSAQIIKRNENGFTVQINVAYNRSMLDFEETLQQEMNAAGVLATQEGLRQFDTDGSPITVGSLKLTSKGQLPKDYQTPYGTATVWDRSAEWSQLRSTRRQRSWWPARVGRGRRTHPPRSARCEKRGVRSSQEYGVAELGTDGPARRSSLLSPAWWTGPPPIPRCGPPRATNRMTRSSRRSPPQEAAHGFWIRAWGQREPALQGTGRLSNSARCGVAAQGWIGHPGHSFSLELMLHRTPDPDVGARTWSRARRVGTLRLVQLFPLVKRTPHVVHQRIEQDLGHSAVPRRDDRPFVEAANSCLTRTVRRRDG